MKRAWLLLLGVLALPGMSCVMASQVAVKVITLPVQPSKLETAVQTVEDARVLASLALDASMVEAITPYTVPGLGEITNGTHATARHAAEAEAAREMLAQQGTECHDCADGRTRCWNFAGSRYALGVYVRATLVEITAFLMKEQDLEEVLDECDGSGNPMPPYAW
jgi:hypothetical protein